MSEPGSRRALTVTLIIVCQSMQAPALGGLALFPPPIREDVRISFSQAGSLAAAGDKGKDATGSFDAGLWALAALCVAGVLAALLIPPVPARPPATAGRTLP